MKKIHLYMALVAATAAAMTVTSCADSESDPTPPDTSGGAIRFAANIDYSRSSDITTNNLTSFNVYAYTGTSDAPKVLMDNVTVSKSGTNTWTYSPLSYWPAHEKVDFYAFAPASWVGTAGPLKPVAYDSYPGDEDIVYAVSAGMQGNTGMANPQVVMNFRHALSKVTVKMHSSDTTLTVKVSNVALAGILTKGNFHFPSETTAGTPRATTMGRWTDQNTPMTYLLHISQSPSDLITLTTTATDMSDTGMGMGGAKFMMPQDLSYTSGSGADNYLAVMCSIYDSSSGAKLWPNANTPKDNIVEGSTFGDGVLKFPLNTSSFTAWMPGVHYIYNLEINANSEMGSINFGTPSVDTYIEVIADYK